MRACKHTGIGLRKVKRKPKLVIWHVFVKCQKFWPFSREKTWCNSGFFSTTVNRQYVASILLVRSRVLIAWLAHEGLLCCKVLFACQAVAPAWVALLPLSKVHPNRPNVLLLVLKFQYCNIGYWTSISRICVWEKIPRRTQSKLGKSWLSEHFRRQGFWPGSPCPVTS